VPAGHVRHDRYKGGRPSLRLDQKRPTLLLLGFREQRRGVLDAGGLLLAGCAAALAAIAALVAGAVKQSPAGAFRRTPTRHEQLALQAGNSRHADHHRIAQTSRAVRCKSCHSPYMYRLDAKINLID
jgi:hypothetical protein